MFVLGVIDPDTVFPSLSFLKPPLNVNLYIGKVQEEILANSLVRWSMVYCSTDVCSAHVFIRESFWCRIYCCLTEKDTNIFIYDYEIAFSWIGWIVLFCLAVLGIEPRASCVLGKRSTSELDPQIQNMCFSFVCFFFLAILCQLQFLFLKFASWKIRQSYFQIYEVFF